MPAPRSAHAHALQLMVARHGRRPAQTAPTKAAPPARPAPAR